LVLAGTALLGFQIKMFRADFARDLNAVANIVGANSTAAIAFNDPKAATEILQSLRAKDSIVSAILILPDGTVFASYGHHVGAPAIAAEDRILFRDRDALMIEPVILDGNQVATLNVVSDFRTVYTSLLKLVRWMLLIVAVVGIGVALFLSNWLQRFISDPVLRLTRTAQTVADHNDYSVRAHEETTAELGILTRTFNQMLGRIQQQDEAITLSQEKLEALINSIEGVVWECTPDNFHFTFVSRQSERILGYTPEQWRADPRFWHRHLHPGDAEQALQLCRDYSLAGKPYSYEYRMLAADGHVVWIRESGSVLVEHDRAVARRGIFLDITAQKTAADELDRLNRRLLETSRLAGMAEVATGVLHNVGNVLTSVSVSATIVGDRLKQSKVANLRRATTMLQEKNGQLAAFLANDPKGKVLPEYLCAVAAELTTERSELLGEVTALSRNIEHIKEIVAMQQSYARVSGAFEHLPPTDLVEDALRMNAAAFERHGIKVVRHYAPDLPKIRVDRHKVLQILVNLVRNAKYAMDTESIRDKCLVLRAEATAEGTVNIRVRDNGVGIAPENLTRIFQHGFTTKKDGHGFGLHSGANAARELGGRLSARSDGLGHGAEFTLELPIHHPQTGLAP
jgi:PAS domain S-box-containing protein